MEIIQMVKRFMHRFHLAFRTMNLLLVVLAMLAWEPLSGKNQLSKGLETIVIDPGHGGKDPGAVVGNAREKDIVLSIALKLGKLIREKLPDVKIIFTRNTDEFIPLYERSAIANKNNADLFVSIHANYCNTPSVKGTETYVLGLHRTEDNLNVAKKENSVILLEKDHTTRYEGFDPNLSESYIIFELIQNTHIDQSVMFAGILQDSFRHHAQRANRDVRQAGFLVLRETAMPSVLIETGYLSNLAEANYLMTNEGRETIARSIFNSFQQYKDKYESRLNLTSKESKSAKKEAEPDIPAEQTAEVKSDSTVAPEVEIGKKLKDSTTQKSKPVVKSKIKVEVKKEKGSVKNPKSKISFAIQLSASPKKIPLNSRIFKGIENISEFNIDGFFKYYCSRSNSFSIVRDQLSSIRAKIPGAFIIAFNGDQPVSIKEAMNVKK